MNKIITLALCISALSSLSLYGSSHPLATTPPEISFAERLARTSAQTSPAKSEGFYDDANSDYNDLKGDEAYAYDLGEFSDSEPDDADYLEDCQERYAAQIRDADQKLARRDHADRVIPNADKKNITVRGSY